MAIKGLEIAGPATTSYLTYNWGSDITRGIVVARGVTGFDIEGNNIHGTRNDILIDGINNTGSIKNNPIDNSKSGISIQYTDGTGIAITGNSEGVFGNEWGVNLHLNGHYDAGTNTFFSNSQKIASDAPLSVQQQLLALAAANGGWSVQDQGYNTSNRTIVTVATTGSNTNQGSQLSALGSIQAGINAVVTGGTVDVKDGTYTIASGGGNYIDITKSLNLVGQSEAGTIIDASAASSYGMRVQADDVSLSDFTLLGSAGAGGYGFKVEPLEGSTINPNDRVHNFSISNVTEKGSTKNGLDLNGVVGATIANVSISGTKAGTGIAITDSANVTLTGDITTNNAWGGLAIYEHNATYNQQVNNIVVDGTNTFNEANPVYVEDESASLDVGTINLTGQGFAYVAKNHAGPNDDYTFFQKTEQGAIDIAALEGATTAYVEGYAGVNTNGTNTFYVGTSSGGTAMSIGAAASAAADGAGRSTFWRGRISVRLSSTPRT